jgi:hypothetical protein
LETVNEEEAIATAAYSAAELDVEPGDTVQVHAEGGGWLWCEDESSNFGWVPAACVKQAPDH